MYVAVLPRKIVGSIFCIIGALVMIIGIAGDSSRNGGPVISIIVGSMFAGIGWMAIKSSAGKRPVAFGEQRGLSVPISSGIAPNTSDPQLSSTRETSETAHTGPSAVQPGGPPLQAECGVAESVAKLISAAFSSAHYIELFGDKAFSTDWTVQDGLAVWYCLGAVALDIAVFTTISSKEQSRRFRDICDKHLSKEWKMPEAVLSRFNSYMATNGEATFFAFTGCKSASELEMFSSSCTNRIMGANLPFKGLAVDFILQGHEPKSLDPFLATAFFGCFHETIIEAKKIIGRAAT